MERNPNDNFDSQDLGQTGGTSGSSGLGGSSSGYGTGGSSGYGASGAGLGSTGAGSAGTLGGSTGAGMSGTGTEQGMTDKARDQLGNVREKAREGLSTAREKAGQLKNSLADKLDAGADRLRGQGGQTYAAATGDGGVGMREGQLDRVREPLASGMHSTAEWLRENDLDSLKQGIETQVREHPGRTLLIAAGLGYLIGKAFRR